MHRAWTLEAGLAPCAKLPHFVFPAVMLRPAALLPPSPACHQTDLTLLFLRAFERNPVLGTWGAPQRGLRWGPRKPQNTPCGPKTDLWHHVCT